VSKRQLAENRVYKYKKDPNEEEEFTKVPFLRSNRKRDIKDKQFTNAEDEDYWRNKKALKTQNKVRSRRHKLRRGFARSLKASLLKVNGVYSKKIPNPYQIPLQAPELESVRARNRVRDSAKANATRTIVTNIHELRHAVLDEGIELKDIEFENVSFIPSSNVTKATEEYNPFNHEVIKLIEKRASTNSKPGARASDDNATLALSIEGGGMRGAVSAGMASAIAVLGISDAFDSIYGSSAGSIVGAYMVSRQMCIDVYTDVLTTAKTKFVSKGRLASSLATGLFDTRVLNNTLFSKYVNPAMNISFVLDGIMCPEQGLRPLDVDTFMKNDARQNLRVVTSTVRNGKMETHCLGSRTMDFFDRVDNRTGEVLERATTMLDKDRHGLFACLETSMLVPAATGPPLALLRHKDAHLNITTHCFDAFCYEPIPYRSAVEEGATHVLALKTRPDGKPISTKQGLFEKYFAPMHFDTNDMSEVSKYFENGGQQYIYVEDYLTLDEGKMHSIDVHDEGILVPPQKILYGVERDDEAQALATNRDDWKRAHLFPLAVPEGTPELSVLSVDQDEVLEGVRLGFAAAFDLLAPLVKIDLNEHLDGERVAELLFSHVGTAINVLEEPVSVAGDFILETESLSTMEKTVNDVRNAHVLHEYDSVLNDGRNDKQCQRQDASDLLDLLPGFHQGKMESLSKGLQQLKKGEGQDQIVK